MMGDCKICVDDKSCCHTALEINQSQEIERLNAQVAILHDVLDKLAKLGNGDRFGNSVGNCMAQDALQKSPSYWLKTHDAKIRDEALEEAIRKCIEFGDTCSEVGQVNIGDCFAEEIRSMKQNHHAIKFGCHCELDPGQEPDACVLDTGKPNDCALAARGQKKETCIHWRQVEAKP